VVAQRGSLETGPLISGTLQATRRAALHARLGGSIRQVGPELGERVRRGETLARIDPGPLGATLASARAQLASARSALETARRDVERTRALVAAGAIPHRELERTESQLAAQQAAVDQTRAQVAAAADQLADARVRSPLAGVVARRAVDVGDVVESGALLYEIVDPSAMRLSAAVPSDQVSALAVGKPARFTVRGYPGVELMGAIAHVSPVADPVTRQIPVLVDIPNTAGRLFGGLFAQGRIVAERADGIVLPLSAVDMSTQPAGVFRVANGTVERVAVTLGMRDPLHDLVIVTHGLAVGDFVVRDAALAPPPGTRVAPPVRETPRSTS
jgi:RND family efflux transporter MFP subunit